MLNARQLYIIVVGISKNLLEKRVFFIVFATICDIILLEGAQATGLWSLSGDIISILGSKSPARDTFLPSHFLKVHSCEKVFL